ncbi:MAG: zinc-dependent metalloprotease [Fimbriimonadaceae bacterium]|nr:zinc-dependent metalloprotease [Fimbriimonadaceae bacterium]
MHLRIPFLAMALAASFCVSGFVLAQEPPPAEKTKQETPKKDTKVEEFEKAIKDLPRFEGAITLYKRKNEILAELPESRIGELMFVQGQFNTGFLPDTIAPGFPIGDLALDVFRLQRNENNLWLVRPPINHRWSQDNPLKTAAERNFPEAILASYRIEATHPEKKLLLVNVTPIFMGELLRLNEAVPAILGGPYMLDREKSSTDEIRAFPDNTLVRMKLHYFSQRGGQAGGNPLAALLGLAQNHLEDDRSAPLTVTYNVWFRRESDYSPRLYDPRVGFFHQEFFSIDRFFENDRKQRFIFRYNLKKKDPTAKLSEPVKPIVWHIDPSVPHEYREACRDAVLMWNKAFEEIGYKNALVVKIVDESDKEYSLGDARYNTISWSISENQSYAIAQPRIDPFTGEVLNASVICDANMLSFTLQEHARSIAPSLARLKRATDVFTHDEHRDKYGPADRYIEHGDLPQHVQDTSRKLAALGWRSFDCSYAREASGYAAEALKGLEAVGSKVSPKDFALQFFKEIVGHEVGHALGLRHSFASSTFLTTSQLDDDDLTSRVGTTASIMDYTPTNTLAVLKGRGNFFSPTIGVYDKWAIKYGYVDGPNVTMPEGERYFLSRIASQSGMPGLKFMTDEDADTFDPYAVRFDDAKDPLNFSTKNLQLADKVRKWAITQLPRPGESYGERTEIILGTIARTFREGRYAARFVGGIAGNRNFAGDRGQTATLPPVPSADQRQAVQMIARYCFSSTALDLPESVLLNLRQEDKPYEDNTWTAPVRQIIGQQQSLLYASLMSAQKLNMIAENAYKTKGQKGAYTLEEHFATLLGAVFSEVGQNKSIAPVRRDLQRFAINGLIIQASAGQGAVNEDVRILASDSLRRLSIRYGTQMKSPKGLDSMTVIYLRDTKETIDRFLNRTQVIGR